MRYLGIVGWILFIIALLFLIEYIFCWAFFMLLVLVGLHLTFGFWRCFLAGLCISIISSFLTTTITDS